MKKLLVFVLLISAATASRCFGQSSGSFTVQGNLSYFYPVLIQDPSWSANKATEFELGRSNVHTDVNWRGSLISKFRIHTTDWGNGSNFIDADIRQFDNTFIADWTDATTSNANHLIIVWLRGGGTTYYFNSPASITPVVYDGVANALPYAEPNGPSRTYKTSVAATTNVNGTNISGSVYATGSTPNYFAGNVGIGTTSPDQKLTVNGTIHAKLVVVDLNIVPDYVFKPAYKLPSLDYVKNYVDKNSHLPDVPSEAEIKKNGLNVGEMNAVLLKKVEELTLYMIELNKTVKKQQKEIEKLKKKN